MSMQRFPTSLFGIVGAVLLIAFVITFSNGADAPTSPTIDASSSSSALFTPPNSAVSPLTPPNTEPKTGVAVSSQKELTPPVPTQTPAPSAAVSTTSPSLTLSSDPSALALRSALVNIICYAPTNSVLHSISGSGVFIDSKGIILTNAHIAQYFLLADHSVSCIIRTGGPAVNSYKAAPIYISPEWLNANSNVLTEVTPSGTGQYDFALLAVTASATTAELPATFPYVPLATQPPSIGTTVVIASYAAQSLGYNQIESDLFPTIVSGSVKNVFTFAVSSVDVLALGGSAAAQEGSSGGGVVDSQEELVGMLTTSTISGATSTRALDAITASYIRNEYQDETGQTLDSLLAEPPATSISAFAPRISNLEAIITEHLP